METKKTTREQDINPRIKKEFDRNKQDQAEDQEQNRENPDELRETKIRRPPHPEPRQNPGK